ncbi:MAG: hypothetical protein F4X55_07225 [Candidatus Dadabacteria bacterium]|nr:hypothetical protein [Candidatus Dadabacteria bacterium]MYC40779.1 hypothetical protein [Candidatus Dadabacteria bacterium]
MSFDIIKNKQNFLTRALLLLLALTFVIGFGYVGGISIGGRGPSGGVAVEVNGDKVSIAQFYNLRDSMLDRLRRSDQEISDELVEYVNFAVIDSLVNKKLLAQKAEKLGIRVSQEELSDAIRNDPGFQVDGAFVGFERYRDFISRGLNRTVKDFEDSYREDLLVEKLVSVLDSSITASDEELLSIYRMREEEIDLYYVSFAAEDYTGGQKASEEEIARYYRANTDLFWEPEKRKARYVKLSPGDFAGDAEVSDEEIEAYYRTYPEEFASDGTPKPLDEVREEIRKQLVDGKASLLYDRFLEEFVRKKRLSDLLSERSSLEVRETAEFTLGGVGGDVPGAIRREAFSVKKNRLANVVLRDFTWFFEVTRVERSRRSGIEPARGEILRALNKEKAVERARETAGGDLGKIKASAKGFAAAAKSLDHVVEQTGFFSRSENPLGVESGDFISDVFGLRSNRPTMDRVYRSGETFYIVSLAETKPVDSGAFGLEKDSFRRQEVSARKALVVESLLEKLRESSKISPNKNLLSQGG